MSHKLVRDYATDLGYEYLSASNKDEFNASIDRFLTPEMTEKPMLFEVFTETESESQALETALNFMVNPKEVIKNNVKHIAKNILGDAGIEIVKKVVKR